LLHEELGSAEAQAVADWYASLIEHAAADVRALFGKRPPEVDPETIFFTRNFVRLSSERARDFRRRLEDLQADLLAADDAAGELRLTFTTAFVPVLWSDGEATGRTNRRNDRRRRRDVHEHDVEASAAGQ
jgi:hypothetical protein